MIYFIVFKKQKGEIKNAYSVVDRSLLQTIPQNIVLAKKEIENKLYTTQELEIMRDELVSSHPQS